MPNLHLEFDLLETPQIDQRFSRPLAPISISSNPQDGPRARHRTYAGNAPDRRLFSSLDRNRQFGIRRGSQSKRQAIRDPAKATRLLRKTALSVVPAQVRSDQTPVLRLSGGLNSSIIAACLAAHAYPTHCASISRTKARDGDERHFARDVTRKFNLQLIEVAEPGTTS